MAWIDIGWDPEELSYRTSTGCGGIVWPSISGTTETVNTCGECTGCTKLSSHQPGETISTSFPIGLGRHDNMPESNKFPIEALQRIHFGLWSIGYIVHGLVNPMCNLGAGNNASQWYRYEIVSASGNTLTLRGTNPKRIGITSNDENPDWPMVPGRLIQSTSQQAIPLGAAIRFLPPSIISGHVQPYIKSISINDDDETTTFSVNVTSDISNAKEHENVFYSSGTETYYCDIGWHALAPEELPNWQVDNEIQFSAITRDLSPSEVSDGGPIELFDHSDNSTRILFPGMMQDAITVRIVRDSSDTKLSDSEILERLETSGSNPYETTFDVTGLDFDDLVSIGISYYCEATDNGDPNRILFNGACINSQRDRTGSYVTTGGSTDFCAYCDADLRGSFHDDCWQPKCSGFGLGNESNQYGLCARSVANVYETKWWSPLFTRTNWILVQDSPGSSGIGNSKIQRPDHPGTGIESLLGGFINDVPDGYFPTITELTGLAMCGLSTSVDENGDEQFDTANGAFILSEAQGVTGTPTTGLIPGWIGSGWTSGRLDPNKETPDTRWLAMPEYIGNTNCYNYNTSGSSYGYRSRLLANQEYFITGINTETINSSLIAKIQGML